MLIARDPQLSPSRPLACGSFRGSPTTPCWPRLGVRCGLAARSPWLCAFSAHLSWLLIVAWRRMGERGRSFGGGASFPGPCSPIVPLAAPSRWLTVLPSSAFVTQFDTAAWSQELLSPVMYPSPTMADASPSICQCLTLEGAQGYSVGRPGVSAHQRDGARGARHGLQGRSHSRSTTTSHRRRPRTSTRSGARARR